MTLAAEALVAPAAARNRDPILEVLRRVLPRAGTVLEVASGSGEHAVHFAAALPHLAWQPSDREPASLRSIAAYREAAALPNLLPAVPLDAAEATWPLVEADAIVSINMIHIAPWSATLGLMAGAGRLLAPGGVLLLYGPFRESGVPLAASNTEFDASLRARDPSHGLRDLDRVSDCAAAQGLELRERVVMPANNLSLIFERR